MKNLYKLFLLATILIVSCQKDHIEIPSDKNADPQLVEKAAGWYRGQMLKNGKLPDWENAVVKEEEGVGTLVIAKISEGKNSRGLDSIKEVHVVIKDDQPAKGVIRTLSFTSEERADILFSTLNGRKMESGELYQPTDTYTPLKRYNYSTMVLMGFEEGPYYANGSYYPGSETPRENPDGSKNSNAYNCHTYAWGPPERGSTGYDPKYPQWNNKPIITGYSTVPNSAAAKVGDKVIYYGSGVYGNNTALHSGIVTGVDEDGNVIQITSKWGWAYIQTSSCGR